MGDAAMKDLYSKAHAAGMVAGNSAVPDPMVVVGRVNPLNDKSAVKSVYVVPDGPCGFAYVKIRPASGPFVSWLKANKIGFKAYGGGYELSVPYFNQSVVRKEAYAHAFADVLEAAGLKAYGHSRMD